MDRGRYQRTVHEPASQARANQGLIAPVTLIPVSIPQIQQAVIGR